MVVYYIIVVLFIEFMAVEWLIVAIITSKLHAKVKQSKTSQKIVQISRYGATVVVFFVRLWIHVRLRLTLFCLCQTLPLTILKSAILVCYSDAMNSFDWLLNDNFIEIRCKVNLSNNSY